MIKIEKVEVFNFEGAIRGCRNPLNSWDKSDSEWEFVEDPSIINPNDEVKFVLGENDLALMRKLCRAGSDHRKFLRQILVSMDITAPLYWWKEFDTYKVGTVANSCSTMHAIHKKEFTRDDFSTEHLGCLISSEGVPWDTEEYFDEWITLLNVCRDGFIKTKDKSWWWQLIQMLPSSYNQRRTVTLNYEVLLNMYHARRNHKLDEWRQLCNYIETMPYFSEICCN